MAKSALESAKELLKQMQENPAAAEELKKAIYKDDKPHAPNTPQDKAHDVVETHEPLPQAMKENKGSQSKLLAYLRTLHNRSQLRSPENRAAGVEKAGPGMGTPKPTAPKPTMPMPAPSGMGGGQGPRGSGAPKPKPIVGNARKEELDKAKIIAGPGHSAAPGTVLANLPTKETPRRATMTRTGTAADATIHPGTIRDRKQSVAGKKVASTRKKPAKPMKPTGTMNKSERTAFIKAELAELSKAEAQHEPVIEDTKPKWKKMSKAEIKEEMSKDEWKPKYHKAEAGANPTSIPATKIIKPSDVKDVGAAGFSVPKDKAMNVKGKTK
jgi:hypothetical protein